MTDMEMAGHYAAKFLSKWWGISTVRPASQYYDALKELTASHYAIMAHGAQLEKQAQRVAGGEGGGG